MWVACWRPGLAATWHASNAPRCTGDCSQDKMRIVCRAHPAAPARQPSARTPWPCASAQTCAWWPPWAPGMRCPRPPATPQRPRSRSGSRTRGAPRSTCASQVCRSSVVHCPSGDAAHADACHVRRQAGWPACADCSSARPPGGPAQRSAARTGRGAPLGLGHGQQPVRVGVLLGAVAQAHLVARLQHVQGQRVGLRVDHHRGEAQLPAGPRHAPHDLAPVGYEHPGPLACGRQAVQFRQQC